MFHVFSGQDENMSRSDLKTSDNFQHPKTHLFPCGTWKFETEELLMRSMASIPKWKLDLCFPMFFSACSLRKECKIVSKIEEHIRSWERQLISRIISTQDTH